VPPAGMTLGKVHVATLRRGSDIPARREAPLIFRID
jgi:hypothetical protein